ncbi:disintegrin and metalloproteinase domain-containing protein 9-like [Heteronotia binoei]|uniref:disintegrin and metalloproteinase domain-containing protein 9-like n=1 Tax=Heteronotia binoei TaxID=13085 RepID=UPI002931C2F0|nr:disintegrin and metalloproteinase domain-containing protein 9-like [Heteronotia binoei]
MPFYTFSTKGERLVDHPYIQDDCYYSGYVEDVPASDVILSTCTGLWGHIQMGSSMYEIQPIENSPTFQHLIYLTAPKEHEPCRGILEDQDELEATELGRGPTTDPSSKMALKPPIRVEGSPVWEVSNLLAHTGPAGGTSPDITSMVASPLLQDPADAAPRHLEYYVVCDSSVYQRENRNETRVMLLMLQIISVLHNVYEEMGLHILLIGMEVWRERDFSIVSQKKLAKTLERFYNYATFELQRHVRFDHATIYTLMGEEGSFGMSQGEHLCLYNHVSVSAVKASASTAYSGVSAAHQLGHSLGFPHDDILGGNRTDCDCDCISRPGRCIMYSGVVECPRLSNCSKRAYRELLQKPGESCLQNLPKETVGYQILGASYNNVAQLWKIGDRKCSEILTGHVDKVTAAKFRSTRHQAVTGSRDRTVKEWDLCKGACSRTIHVFSYCNDIACCDTVIVSGHHDKTIRFWDTREPGCTQVIPGEGKVTSLDLSPDQMHLLSCSRDNALKVIDLRMHNVQQVFRAEGFKVGSDWTKAVFSPDKSYALVGSADGTLFLWNVETGHLASSLPGVHGSSVNGVAWSPSGLYIGSVDQCRKLVLWT